MKIYIATFQVFSPDASEAGTRLKETCRSFGFEPLYPLDNDIGEFALKRQRAAAIFRANAAMILRCDAVAADLNFFRGGDPDAGVAFEVGYAFAMGKPVYGYLEGEGDLAERISALAPACAGNPGFDSRGYAIEDMDLPVNLMIGVPATIVRGGFEDCLAAIAAERAQWVGAGLSAP